MPGQEHYGKNLIGNYFGPDAAIYTVIEGMQQGRSRFDTGLISKARYDVQRKERDLDISTYPFGEDIADLLYEGQPRRVIMFVQGIFHGTTDIQTIIPIDLGNNPYPLFQKADGSTIDATVTFEQTRNFLEHYKEAHEDELARRGIYKFEVGKSRFFYFKETGLVTFFSRFGIEISKGETIHLEDMALLVPLIVPTKYVALEEVEEPSPDWYTELAPTHVSYRLKSSLLEKLVNRLTDGAGKNGNNVRLVADWVAHRPIVPTVEDVNKLEAFLKGNPTIGNSQIMYLYTNDYYNQPPKKGSSRQFKAKNVVVKVATNGYDPAIREIQIVDQEQYFRNELSKGRDGREAFEKRRRGETNVPRRVRLARQKFEEVLAQIFARKDEFMHV